MQWEPELWPVCMGPERRQLHHGEPKQSSPHPITFRHRHARASFINRNSRHPFSGEHSLTGQLWHYRRHLPNRDGYWYACGDSLLTAHRSLLAAHCLLLTAHRSPLTAHRSPLAARCSPLTPPRSPLAAHRSPLTVHCSLLTAHRSQLTAHNSLLTAH